VGSCSSIPIRDRNTGVGVALKAAHISPLFPCSVCSGLTPPKRSRGKPALSRVPFLEGVNGDSDYNSSGEEGIQAELGGPGLPQGPLCGLLHCWSSEPGSLSLSSPNP
jgi:hypothetical protein